MSIVRGRPTISKRRRTIDHSYTRTCRHSRLHKCRLLGRAKINHSPIHHTSRPRSCAHRTLRNIVRVALKHRFLLLSHCLLRRRRIAHPSLTLISSIRRSRHQPRFLRPLLHLHVHLRQCARCAPETGTAVLDIAAPNAKGLSDFLSAKQLWNPLEAAARAEIPEEAGRIEHRVVLDRKRLEAR